jgi:PHP-associated
MSKLLKMDLHSHPIEALKGELGIKGIGDIGIKAAEAIAGRVKQAGLDGIAITERGNFNSGWVASLEIRENFQHENLIILPGAEVEYYGQQFVQIFIPDCYRGRIPFFKNKEWFLILIIPDQDSRLDFSKIDQIAYDAVEEKSVRGNFPAAKQIASATGIPTIECSDAHRLEDIGRYYTEIECQ